MSDNFGKVEISSMGAGERILVVLLALIAVVAISWFATYFDRSSWDFRNNLWAPSHLLVTGRSSYDLSPFNFRLGEAVWFPTVVGIFFPLGWLSQQTASNLWLVLNAGLVLGIVVSSLNTGRPRPWLFGLVLAAMLLFPPTISHFRLGQITLLTAAIFLLIARFLKRLPRPVAAGLIAVALAKPQLAVLVVPGLLIHIWQQNGPREMFGFLAQIAGAGALLTLPLFLAEPSWPSDFVLSLRGNPDWVQPSLLTFLRLQLGQIGLAFWAPVAILLFALNLKIWRKLRPQEAVLWSLALTPVATPYVWSWDFILLLPLFCYMAFHVKGRRALVALITGYVGCWIGAILVAFSAPAASNHLYWWIPWGMLVVTGAATWMERTR